MDAVNLFYLCMEHKSRYIYTHIHTYSQSHIYDLSRRYILILHHLRATRPVKLETAVIKTDFDLIRTTRRRQLIAPWKDITQYSSSADDANIVQSKKTLCLSLPRSLLHRTHAIWQQARTGNKRAHKQAIASAMFATPKRKLFNHRRVALCLFPRHEIRHQTTELFKRQAVFIYIFFF